MIRGSVPCPWAMTAMLALIGCTPVAATPPAPADMSDVELSQELQRCRVLGLESYHEFACRGAQAERTARFFGRPAEIAP